ncbi:MAG TPA: class I SAM-dependent methyltransferase [Terriglobia bacterium]|nr:class I SAM-dependent methyltransferase [Terriglobia bacterium]
MNSGKLAVRDYWDSCPCGSSEVNPGLPETEFFREHARMRYGREPHILKLASFENWQGRRVLEIGVGIGADFTRFRKAGAQAVGLDLSLRSLQLARRNVEVHQGVAPLVQADAEAMPFASASFDMVYAWGVLHHTSGTARALSEVHRVLKPGGECRAMLYHRASLVALQVYLRYGLLTGRPGAPLRSLLARHMQSPGAQAFTQSEVRELFGAFQDVAIEPAVTAYDLRWSRRGFAPRWARRLVPKRFGWFLLVRARKGCPEQGKSRVASFPENGSA